MKNTIYYLLLNLAISDLLFALLAPIQVVTMTNYDKWIFGDAFCKMYYFTFRTLYAFSVLVLVLITTERFFAIRYPLVFKPSPYRTLLIIGALWVVSCLICLPYLLVNTAREHFGAMYCYTGGWKRPEDQLVYYICVYLMLYIIPLISMAFMYTMIAIRLAGNSNQFHRSTIRWVWLF